MTANRGRPQIVERASEAIVGWRAWNLSVDADGPVLHPAGAGTDAWPRGRAMRARCTVPRVLTGRRARHEAPEIACRCGIHAGASLDVVARVRPAWLPAPVIGRVALWGLTVAHERGWRAGRAYPDRLRLVCVMCAWVEPGTGLPTVVHRFGRRLYTLCDEHAGGIEVPDGRRTEPSEDDPRELQARLLGAYAVDLLPAEALEPLYARPAAAQLPGFIPSIRAVPRQHGGAAEGRYNA